MAGVNTDLGWLGANVTTVGSQALQHLLFKWSLSHVSQPKTLGRAEDGFLFVGELCEFAKNMPIF